MPKDELDGRTKEARALAAIKTGLKDAPAATAKQLLRDMVAQNAVITKEIYTKVMGSGSLFDDKDKLNPLISKELPKFQNCSKGALSELLKLGRDRGQDDEDVEDIFDEAID